MPIMRNAILLLLFFLLSFNSRAQQNKYIPIPQSNTRMDSAWVMQATRVTEPNDFLSTFEKEVIQWLNIARMYPKWFIYWLNIKNTDPIYTKTLLSTMMTMQPVTNKLSPSKILYDCAKCHVETSGVTDYTGHVRQDASCKEFFYAECIYYGSGDAASTVEALLIDKGVPDLGHRLSILNYKMKTVGVSHGTHGITLKTHMTVIDFGR